MTTNNSERPKSNRGFASMDMGKQREIASKGGKAAHAQGRAHEFSADEARVAGRKGGEVVSRDRAHMAAMVRRAVATARCPRRGERFPNPRCRRWREPGSPWAQRPAPPNRASETTLCGELHAGETRPSRAARIFVPQRSYKRRCQRERP